MSPVAATMAKAVEAGGRRTSRWRCGRGATWRVADAGREELDQGRRDRAVDHGDVDHEDGQDRNRLQRLGIAEGVEEAANLEDGRIAGLGSPLPPPRW